MTKKEAITAMYAGYKVTHTTFTDGEWMSIQKGRIVTEDGCQSDIDTFFSYRTSDVWNDGYTRLSKVQAQEPKAAECVFCTSGHVCKKCITHIIH